MNKIFLLVLLVFVGCQNINVKHAELKKVVKQAEISSFYLQYLHNKERVSKGISVLELNDELMVYAQKHAEWMAKNNTMRHSNLGFDSRTRGENIAYGQKDEDQVVKVWMNSPGHRRNIMNSKFNRAGFGFAKNKNDTVYWCTVFGGD